MFTFKVIIASVMTLLGFFAAWILFHAAIHNNLPTQVAREACGLGVCTAAMTILNVVMMFRKQPDQLKRSSKGN